MASKYPSPDQPPSTSRGIHHQIAGSTELTIPTVGYMAPRIGQSFNRFQDSSNVHEAKRIEIEKQLIREEIIAEEVARRRMLELEVRRELMMERQVAMWEGDRYASLSFSSRLPFLKQQAEPMLLEEKMGMGVSASAPEQISEVPFQHRAVEPKVSKLKPEILQVQPSFESGLRKDGGFLLAKPEKIFSGAKRKAMTPTEEVADRPSLSSAPKKNVNEWRCALCQVSATSEGGLNNHLQGKKHKRKEAALGAKKDEKNCSIGLFPKKPTFIQVAESCDGLIQEKKSEEGSSSPNDNDALSVLIDDSADDLGKNAIKEYANRGFKFWCEICKIGTFSEKVMETHKTGKKHARHLAAAATSSVNSK